MYAYVIFEKSYNQIVGVYLDEGDARLHVASSNYFYMVRTEILEPLLQEEGASDEATD
jgi:hypothetical protein